MKKYRIEFMSKDYREISAERIDDAMEKFCDEFGDIDRDLIITSVEIVA